MASLALEHVRQHGLDGVDDAQVIDLDHIVDLIHVHRLDLGRQADAGVGHQQIDRPELRREFTDGRHHAGTLTYVRGGRTQSVDVTLGVWQASDVPAR